LLYGPQIGKDCPAVNSSLKRFDGGSGSHILKGSSGFEDASSKMLEKKSNDFQRQQTAAK